MTFWTKLVTAIERNDSLLCVGLDPQPDNIPARHAGIGAFVRAVIDATADLACAYKPNIAFFEAAGEEGLAALRGALAHIPEGIPVILDAKRNDIGSTAAAYARAVFDVWGADAVTLNPYLGFDGVQPFLAYEDRGTFVLCKTSNPSAGELQDWAQAGKPLYQHVADLVATWAGEGEVGLVMGATYPTAMADIRRRWPRTWFLVPGVGAQGGELEAVLRAGLRADGMGVLINASRGIMYAEDPREAALALRAAINAGRRGLPHHPAAAPATAPADDDVAALARLLFAAGCVRFGDFVLHSGAHSPVYIDLRRLVTYPRALDEVARHYARLLEGLSFDRIAAIPYAALPIGTAVSLRTGIPLIYPRRETKSYGTRRQIEGEYNAGERVVLLDDLITSGGSKLETAEPLQAEGLTIEDVVVLIDREQGGAADLAAHGYRLHAAVTLRQIVDSLAAGGQLAPDDARRVRSYLDGL
jgi:uridine monophosphate synthetase